MKHKTLQFIMSTTSFTAAVLSLYSHFIDPFRTISTPVFSIFDVGSGGVVALKELSPVFIFIAVVAYWYSKRLK